MKFKEILKELFSPEDGSPNPKAIYPSVWAYGPSYTTRSYLLEAPEKTLARMKAADKAERERSSKYF